MKGGGGGGGGVNKFNMEVIYEFVVRTNYLQLSFRVLFVHFFPQTLLQSFSLLKMLRKIERFRLDHDTCHSELRFKVMYSLHNLCQILDDRQAFIKVLLDRSECTAVPHQLCLRRQREFSTFNAPIVR